MEKNKTKITYLDRNEHQYGPAPACFEVLKNISSETLSEYSRDFTLGIKSPLSQRLAIEYNIDEKSVLLGFGGEDLLKQTIHCYIQKGDTILLPTYSWWYYKKIVDEVEGIKVEYPVREGEDTFYYDIDGMFKMYETHRPKLVLISSPNNPTGNRLEIAELIRVLEKMKDTLVIVDEAYSLFFNQDHSHLKNIIDRFPNIIVIRTFSKYYSLAGVRIGFALVGRNLEKLATFSARLLGYNRLSEALALAALDSPEYYSDINAKMTADIDLFKNEFNKLPGFTAYKTYANFILVKIPFEIKEPLKKYLTDRNMIVKFMAEDGLFNHIRITIGTQEQNKSLLQMIHSFLSEHTQYELGYRI
ncbi:MAG: aminotransferase class I/II-fold pyridoxal phosphate-dependent enzyme [Saprospiraceae bacterium]